MFGNLSGPTLLVILFIVLLLFGAPKLPALARSLGQSMKILKKEVTTSDDGDAKGEDGTAQSTATAPATPAAPAAPAPTQAAPSADDELARAKAEAEAAKAEAEALRAAAEKRAAGNAE